MTTLLQIIFQSGDFYNEGNSFWSDFLLNAFAALIGTATALLVFYLSIRSEKKKNIDNETKTINQRLHYFYSLAKSITDNAIKQGEYIMEFYKEQEQDDLNIPLIKLLTIEGLKRFSEIQNHEDYYHAYLKRFGYNNETVKEYQRIYNSVDFLKNSIEQQKNMLDISIKFDYERKMKYKSIVEKAMDDVSVLSKDKTIDPKLAQFFNKSLLDFYSEERNHSNLSTFEDHFVKPTKVGLVKDFNDNETAFQISLDLKNATYIYSNIKLNNQKISADFKIIHEEFAKSCDDLKEVVDKLSKEFETNNNKTTTP